MHDSLSEWYIVTDVLEQAKNPFRMWFAQSSSLNKEI